MDYEVTNLCRAGRRPAALSMVAPAAQARPAELCGIEQEMLALDRGLKETAPRAEAPASLHRSIMQAVRAANRPAAAEREPSSAALAAGACTCCDGATGRLVGPAQPGAAAGAERAVSGRRHDRATVGPSNGADGALGRGRPALGRTGTTQPGLGQDRSVPARQPALSLSCVSHDSRRLAHQGICSHMAVWLDLKTGG